MRDYEKRMVETSAKSYLEIFEQEVTPKAKQFGFKFKKGELKFPHTLVQELIADAFMAGAQLGYKMWVGDEE